jgi:Ca2+-transporting ATPase
MGEGNWHAMSVKEVTEHLMTGIGGLSGENASERLERYGPNEIREREQVTWQGILTRQFKNILILLLVIAAVVSLAMGKITDGIAISFAILLSVFFGFLQEYKAEEALEALEKYVSKKAIVIRDGTRLEIEAREVVPGDVLLLEEGEMVPADIRVVESMNLGIDQSSLTGEPYPVTKEPEAVEKDTPLAVRKSIAYMGTTVVRGHGRGIVVETGHSTEFGKIAKDIAEAPERATPLQQRLDEFGKNIGYVAIAICTLFFIFGVLNAIPPERMFVVAVALAVAAIPEGLPTITTMSLAIGMQRMAKENAIVRRLSAVETLGSTTIICTDKTGTLTQNRMTVRRVCLPDASFEIGGESNELKGEIRAEGGRRPSENARGRLEKAMLIGVLCNNATIVEKKFGLLKLHGDPTEKALLIAGEKAGIESGEIRKKHTLIKEFPFDTKRKMMTCIRAFEGKHVAFVKGAPESVLPLCTGVLTDKREASMTVDVRKRIWSVDNGLSSKGMRVIAVAYGNVPKNIEYTMKGTEKGLVFAGFMGMLDPLRPEVKDAVSACKGAGIKVVMLTGDNHLTAVAVGRELGLLARDDEAISGSSIEEMDESEFRAIAKKIKVYSRVTPEYKFRIVKALMDMGEVVAVTGDGVNDAPAIKKADIGVAMGTGTDVSKGASDMILVDDNFATIARAVEYGRNIYNNILNFVRYQLSTNVGALLLMFVAQLLKTPLPLTPVQILWINIIMDGPPALALGAEPPSRAVMKVPPRPPKQSLFAGDVISTTLFNGVLMAFGTFLLFIIELGFGFPVEKAATVAFTTFVLFQLFNALNCRSPTKSIFEDFFSNKYLLIAIFVSLFLHIAIVYGQPFQQIFSTVPLTLGDWLLVLLISSSIMITSELKKRFFAKNPAVG